MIDAGNVMKNKTNKNHPFFDIFEQLMAEKGKKGLGIRAVAFYCGVYPNTICGYKERRHLPNAEQLEKLADYFKVSTDWLLGRTDRRNYDE